MHSPLQNGQLGREAACFDNTAHAQHSFTSIFWSHGKHNVLNIFQDGKSASLCDGGFDVEE